jgi:hypothetical protein
VPDRLEPDEPIAQEVHRIVSAELRRARKQLRRARDVAFADPAAETYHKWRHAVKEQWYQRSCR